MYIIYEMNTKWYKLFFCSCVIIFFWGIKCSSLPKAGLFKLTFNGGRLGETGWGRGFVIYNHLGDC